VKRVLVLAYHFPPVGGAGVQRPTRMVRYLREHGYEPIVVTGAAASLGRWTPEDRSLLDELPDDVAVERIAAPEPPGSDGGDRGERWLGVRSPWSRWWIDGAVELGTKVGQDVDLIYAWMQPYQSAEAGARLGARLQKPWVADLGDPWALDEMMVWPTRWHAATARRKMEKVLASANAIVMSTPEAARRVASDLPLLREKEIYSIPNGFEPEDFDVAPLERREDEFTIVHTGYLHTDLGRRRREFGTMRRLLGGSDFGVDVLTRSHAYLLEALESLKRSGHRQAARASVHLAGVLSEADREVLADHDGVVVYGYLEHREAVALMKSADALFLPMHDLAPPRRATIVPGKTYEYLAAKRPILAAVPDGDARDLLERAGNAILCRPADVTGLASGIERLLAGESVVAEPDPEVVRQFEYEQLAGRLAEVFDGVVRDTDRVSR
jgi:glycosyltransferase involved in cell wall biosynthesis